MPKIFEYLGILIFFYSNEHEPIHVHAKKGEDDDTEASAFDMALMEAFQTARKAFNSSA